MNIVAMLLVSSMMSGVSYTYESTYDGNAVITSVDIPEGITEINIPENIDGYTVTGIESYAFAGQTAIEKVVIPDTVRFLGESSFMSCTSLREATIGAGVTSIPDDCFFACPALKNVILPDTLESIGNETFFGCSVLDLYIPASVVSIGSDAFGKNTDPHSNETVNVYGFLVKGVSGSYAEFYSSENNIDFIDMNNYRTGDINGDGMVDASDASSILEEYSRASTETALMFTKKQNIVGDVDSDGIISANDASYVLEIYANLSTNMN